MHAPNPRPWSNNSCSRDRALLIFKQLHLLKAWIIVRKRTLNSQPGMALSRRKQVHIKTFCWLWVYYSLHVDHTSTGLSHFNTFSVLQLASHQYSRAFLFKQYNHLPQEGILERITQNNVALRPLFIWGIFFEGLVSFQLARQIGRHEQIRKGETALSFFQTWSSRNEWNFANKALLLEAEFHVCTSRDYEKAEDCYVKSIKSAREHNFTHEEAIASELAAKFFYDKGLLQKSYYFFQHSTNCYKKWGALALARGIEIHMANISSPGSFHHGSTDNSLTSLFSEQFHSKKRHQ